MNQKDKKVLSKLNIRAAELMGCLLAQYDR